MVVTVIRMTVNGVKRPSLTDKTKLPVKQLRFGDTGGSDQGYHTLSKLKCYGTA